MWKMRRYQPSRNVRLLALVILLFSLMASYVLMLRHSPERKGSPYKKGRRKSNWLRTLQQKSRREAAVIAPSGEQITITAGDQQAVVVAGVSLAWHFNRRCTVNVRYPGFQD
jgi:hypothetical protein